MAKTSKKQGSNKTTTEPLSPTTLRKTVNIEISTPIDFSSYMVEEHKSRAEAIDETNRDIAAIEPFIKFIQSYKFSSKGVEAVESKLTSQKKKLQSLADRSADVDYDSLIFCKIYQHELYEGESITLARPYVRHYSINSQEAMHLQGQILIQDHSTLHPVENLLFNEAISFLGSDKRCPASEAVSLDYQDRYPSNVVLIDIFPRKDKDIYDNFIICEDKAHKKIAETHTVVLFKRTDQKIILIDPTQKSFSSFLNGLDIDGYVIKTYENREKIYLPKAGKIGNPRDCTDIAVKIAFELMERQKEYQGIPADAGAAVDDVINASLEQVSNIDLPKGFEFFRPLQSSDYELRKAAKDFIDSTPKKVFEILDVTKIGTLEEVNTVSNLIGQSSIDQLADIDTYF